MRLFIVFFAFILLNCQFEKSNFLDNPKSFISIQEIHNLNFRELLLEDSVTQNYQPNQIVNYNPIMVFSSDYDSTLPLIGKLQELKIIEEKSLRLDYFKENLNLQTHYLDSEKTLPFKYSFKNNQKTTLEINITSNQMTFYKFIEFKDFEFLSIQLADIDNDQIKEILVVETQYIMNGLNYNLRILKLIY